MKKTIYLTAIILLVTVFTSCKKETPKPSINGYWSGSVLPTGSSSPQFAAFLYRADGTTRIYASNPDTSLAAKADGTYSMDADSIRTTITAGSEILFFAAKLNSGNQMSGTLRKATSSFTATYSVTR